METVSEPYPSGCQGQARFPRVFTTSEQLSEVLLCPTLCCPESPRFCSGTACAARRHHPNESCCSACACSPLQRAQMRSRGPAGDLRPETYHTLFCLPCSRLFPGIQLPLWASLSCPYKFIPAERHKLATCPTDSADTSWAIRIPTTGPAWDSCSSVNTQRFKGRVVPKAPLCNTESEREFQTVSKSFLLFMSPGRG